MKLEEINVFKLNDQFKRVYKNKFVEEVVEEKLKE